MQPIKTQRAVSYSSKIHAWFLMGAVLQTYGHARLVMGEWAARFVKRLDTIHGDAK